MTNLNTLLQVSQEGLDDYRNPLLRANLNSIIQQARELDTSEKIRHDLPYLLKTIFGIDANIEFAEIHNPAMITWVPLTENLLKAFLPHHISDAEHLRGAAFDRIDHICNGWFNPKTLQMGGVFSEIPVTIYLSPELMEFTDDEIGVAILHEVGHYIDYVKETTEQYRYFSIVESLIRGVRTAPDERVSVEFVRDAVGRIGFQLAKPESLKLARNDDAIRISLYSSYIDHRQARELQGKTSKRAEYIADELPVGVYGAKTTAMVLSSLGRYASSPIHEPALHYHMGTALAIFGTVCGVLAGSAALIAIGTMVSFYGLARTSRSFTHPDPLERLQRIRTLITAAAKNPKMPRSEVIRLTDELKHVNNMIDQLGKANRTLRDVIVDCLKRKPSLTGNVADMDVLLDQLHNNPLYLRSAQLNLIKE